MLKRILAFLILSSALLCLASCSDDDPGEMIFVQTVEVTNVGLKHNDTWGKYVVIYPDEKGEMKYQVTYRVYPENASNKQVNFSYDRQNTAVSVDENGMVSFTDTGYVTVLVDAMDGGGAGDSITVIALK